MGSYRPVSLSCTDLSSECSDTAWVVPRVPLRELRKGRHQEQQTYNKKELEVRAKEMHFRYWTSSQEIIYFLFLPFFPMTTRNRQIQNFTSNFGPQHPAAHGVSRSVLEMNGEVVERAEPHIGSLQCGTKPLMPSRLLCR